MIRIRCHGTSWVAVIPGAAGRVMRFADNALQFVAPLPRRTRANA